jgi:3-phenylpropionate/trans-cinnamate dioxygenase ferredoxin reductase component
MAEQDYTYVIVGGGLAGASAVEGIREVDPNRPILLLGAERHLPYHRPPLTKGLWTGKEQEPGIYVHDRSYYEQHGVTLLLGRRVTGLNPKQNQITDDSGRPYHFHKLLLATGGTPKPLSLPGADLPGIHTYRTLDDYSALRGEVRAGQTVLVIGGGFIGSELAAALAQNQIAVTMLFPDPYLVNRIFPADLGQALQRYYQDRGVTIYAGEKPASITKQNGRWLVRTDRDRELAADNVVIGIGIRPNLELAEAGALGLGNGIRVNERLETSEPDIFAAGDIAEFTYAGLNQRMRLEHWDNAVSQGKQAGRNMAGAGESFTYQPFFFSDLFDFGYEAVGDIDSRLRIVADWREPYKTGTLFYLEHDQVRGVMLCNLPDRIEAARELINRREPVQDRNLAGLFR